MSNATNVNESRTTIIGNANDNGSGLIAILDNADPIDQDKVRKSTIEKYDDDGIFIKPYERALRDVADYVNKHLPKDHEALSTNEINLVWFSYTLGGWKALAATALKGDHRYFEITYNKNTGDEYLDVYQKRENIVIKHLSKNDDPETKYKNKKEF